ncbi:hypothetical protein NQ314_017262 [Rhamnusium bicolor]|uniref:Uncharacterized protein n=1 Tax=Rhamnusium bicolor TaxID=1586634 RepID=A0AAV8WUV9_9CUCU|nr:hypothetical protein NQ314_017262 [Rhamnusium bicolor]
MYLFSANCRNPENRQVGSLSVSELDKSLKTLVKISQQDSFQTEIHTLRKGISQSKGKLLNLNPFLDPDDILRVGGRLQRSHFSFDKKTSYRVILKSLINEVIISN